MKANQLFVTPNFAVGLMTGDAHERVDLRLENPLLALMFGGSYVGYPNNKVVEMGTAVVSPARSEHCIKLGRKGAACISVVPRPGWLPQKDIDALFKEARAVKSDAVIRSVSRMREIACGNREQSDLTYLEILAIESSIVEVLIHLIQRYGRNATEDWVKLIRLKIVAHPMRRWAVMELAESVERHPVYIARAFRERYGESIGRFFRRSRMEHCRALVTEGRTPLTEIAFHAGFADQSHFTQQYRKMFGTTPGEARDEHKALEALGGD